MVKIACICPTYKRSRLLRNAVACFNRQDYPAEDRALFILDDAGQHDAYHEGNIRLDTCSRLPTLPIKYNVLFRIAEMFKPDVYTIWEDDDIFLPHHLKQVAQSFAMGGHYIRLPVVWSNYAQPKGKVIQESAAGRFHSSWSFSRAFINDIGGYPITDRLDFDQQMGSIASQYDRTPKLPPGWTPSYVYRWGNGVYHGSARGEKEYQQFWKELEQLQARRIRGVIPLDDFDEETKLIFKTLGID